MKPLIAQCALNLSRKRQNHFSVNKTQCLSVLLHDRATGDNHIYFGRNKAEYILKDSLVPCFS